MNLMKKEIIIVFDELKKRFGHTKEFQEFEKKHHESIEFIKFKQKHGLRWSKKSGWNKPFYPTVESIWIKDRKNYNKGLRKYGYYQNIQTGWKLGKDDSFVPKCKWCGKILLEGKRTKFCSEKNDSHRKLYSKVMIKGKEICGFDINKNYHILIKPRLYKYETSQSGELIENPTGVERIEFKDIEFSINGKRYPLTTKSRTI